MDVRSLFLLALTLGLLGCGGQGSSRRGKVVPLQKSCLQNARAGEFVVRWKDGSHSLHYFRSEAEIEDQLLSDRADEVEFVQANLAIARDFDTQTVISLEDAQANWGQEQVKGKSLWDQGIFGQDVVVAVIDTGVDTLHPSLQNNIFLNPGEAGEKSQNGVDDDGNGYVDDVSGWDFVFDSPEVQDSSGHGTHVSGIIAAKHSGPVQGMAPKAKILPLDFINPGLGGSTFDAIRAIDYAVVMGAQVINASWGGPGCDVALGERIRDLENVLFIAAAGNESSDLDRNPEYPASFNLPAQLTVGSVGQDGLRAYHSNYGRLSVHLFAPGLDILSSVPGGAFEYASGTSMATPFVAGAAALLWSAQPKASASEIKKALLAGVQRSDSLLNLSRGRLDVSGALRTMGTDPR